MQPVKRYTDYAQFLARHFSGKVQKIAVDGGFTCPNRDGSKGTGGCTYCSNPAFAPRYCSHTASVADQIEAGKRFFAGRYSSMSYLAYFQSYSSTYASVDTLRRRYGEALAADGVVGLVISTRPDCITPDVVQLLAYFATRTTVIVELGIESSHDTTLAAINRCHSWSDSVNAVTMLHEAGIPCGAHLILGLPGEDVSMMLETADRVVGLPISTLKLHQLQLVRGTCLASLYEQGKLQLTRFTPHEYARLCADVIRHTPTSVAFDRFVSQMPSAMLVGPRWGIKQSEFQTILDTTLSACDARQADSIGLPHDFLKVEL